MAHSIIAIISLAIGASHPSYQAQVVKVESTTESGLGVGIER